MLLSELTSKEVENDFEVSKLCLDSRKCEKNSIFFAIKGNALNGEDYINKAIENGAESIVVSKTFSGDILNNIEVVKVENVQQTLADYCARFFTNIPKHIVAVTGTNGKTSTACFYAKIISNLGHKSASIGTLGALIDGDFNQNIDESGLTTPDVITLYETLENLNKLGVEYVCLEASSHGLIQKRLGNLKFEAAGFLNLSQDHLDYHNTMEEYFSAKRILFTNHLKTDGTAILNADICEFNDLKEFVQNYISFGRNAKSMYKY